MEFIIGDYRYKVINDGEVSVRAIAKRKARYDPIPRTVEHEGVLYTVTDMQFCFHSCSLLKKAPAIPCGVENMYFCFAGCSALVKAPVIPNGVTNMAGCFADCSALVEAPVIPDSVANMYECFKNCTSLVEAPAIPNSGTDMLYCFSGCRFEGAFAASVNASLNLFDWFSK